MDRYVAMLNLDRIEEHARKNQNIFETKFQETVTRRVLLGADAGRGLALDKAINNLLNENILETYKCKSDFEEILMQHKSWKGIINHLWIKKNEKSGALELGAFPYNNSFIEFCRHYSLPEEAAQGLADFICATIYKNK